MQVCCLITIALGHLGTHYSPLTTHYSLLTTHYSLLTTHYSPLTTHHSPLTTHYSLLTTHYSLLTTHYSLFTTPIPVLSLSGCSKDFTVGLQIFNFNTYKDVIDVSPREVHNVYCDQASYLASSRGVVFNVSVADGLNAAEVSGGIDCRPMMETLSGNGTSIMFNCTSADRYFGQELVEQFWLRGELPVGQQISSRLAFLPPPICPPTQRLSIHRLVYSCDRWRSL